MLQKTILSTQTRLYLPSTGVVVGNAVVVSSKTQIQYLTQIKVCNFFPFTISFEAPIHYELSNLFLPIYTVGQYLV